MRVTAEQVVDAGELASWTQPWDGLVREAPDGDGGFRCDEGPFRAYRRTIETTPAGDGRTRVRSTVDYRVDVPYFFWLIAPLLRWPLRKAGAPTPFWGPVDRLDQRAARVLGILCGASLVGGFVGTSITQTITYAVDEFGIESDRPQGYALAATRLGVVLALVLVATADRRGRRHMLLVATAGASAMAAMTALSPNLVTYTAIQTVARGFSMAQGIVIVVVAAEEMPRGARAFGASVLGMTAALGAGVCVMALPLADVAEWGWRLVFLFPLLGLVLVRDLVRRLPESKRFEAEHPPSSLGAHRDRLVLLAVSVFLFQLFTAPASQLQNEFLRDERGYSASLISLMTVCTATPAGIGVLVGGRLADARGRRIVAGVAIVGGVGGTLAHFFLQGPAMWLALLTGAVVGAATIPALGVYGPELFATGARGRSNGALVAAATIGSSTGLLLAGVLSDELGSLGSALSVLAIGPAILVVILLPRYPETAGLELEDLNPEDRRASPPPSRQ